MERFCAASRVVGSGDCEDLAREMVTVACAISRGRWKHPVVAAVKAVLRCYVVRASCVCPWTLTSETGACRPSKQNLAGEQGLSPGSF